MKKLIIICLIMAMLLSGCKKADMAEGTKDGTSMFVVVEQESIWKVVYHRETKVLYVVSNASYNSGTFTLLVDTDGKPLLYKEAEE